MSDLKVQGRLCEVFPTEQKTEAFSSRNFVIETDGHYPQFVQFQLVQDRCGIIDSHRIGDLITVHFDLRGKKWNEKYITNLNAWKIEGQNTPQTTPLPPVGNTPPYDLPPATTPAQTNITANHDLPPGDPLAAALNPADNDLPF